MTGKRIRDYGICPGYLPAGPYNRITDVPGVRVGHCTVDDDRHKTGVTVVLPHSGNLYRSRVTAACHVINGFGKTTGLMQIGELGMLETPIALTGTLNVGRVFDGLVEYTLRACAGEDGYVGSVNAVVGETNDSAMNDVCDRVLGYPEVAAAIENACVEFAEGDVGAGKGTTCFGLKGGIGSASRVVEIGGRSFTLGALVQSNFGSTRRLTVDGRRVGEWIVSRQKETAPMDQGSVMVVLACNLPVDARQLGRLCRRATPGLARTGSYLGHGSGDVVIGFTTANPIREDGFYTCERMPEQWLEQAFSAVAESVEEAVLNSLVAASPVTSFRGFTRESLADLLPLYLGI